MTNDDLTKIMAERGITQRDLAEALGISPDKVSKSFRGTRLWKAAEWEAIKKYIQNGDTLTPVKIGPMLHIIGAVAAGVWHEVFDAGYEEFEKFTGRGDIDAPISDRFGLRVVGDSMNLRYPPGSILECVKLNPFARTEIENGKRVIVQRKRFSDGFETTVKEYLRDGDGIEWLVPQSTNPAFQAPFRVDQPGEGIESIEIIAIVVASTILE